MSATTGTNTSNIKGWVILVGAIIPLITGFVTITVKLHGIHETVKTSWSVQAQGRWAHVMAYANPGLNIPEARPIFAGDERIPFIQPYRSQGGSPPTPSATAPSSILVPPLPPLSSAEADGLVIPLGSVDAADIFFRYRIPGVIHGP